MREEQGTLFGDGEQGERLPRSETERRVAEMWAAGDGPQAISKSLGISSAYVTKVRMRLGLSAHQPKATADTKEMILRLFHDGLRACEIVRRTGISSNVVLRVARNARITLPNGRSKTTQGDIDDIVSSYISKESTHSIAARHGLHTSTVLRIVKKQGEETRVPNRDLPKHLKRCPRCRKVKSRSVDFGKATGPSGKKKSASWCRECNRAAANTPQCRERARAANNRLRLEMIAAYGGRCACCGESRWEFLTLDHVHGGGAKHRRELKKKGAEFFRWLKRQGWPKAGYEILCFSCNLGKSTLGRCPHQGPVIPDDCDDSQLSDIERKRRYVRQLRRRIKAEGIAAYGSKCSCCGESEPGFLNFDHIHGDGAADRKATGGTWGLLFRLRREGWPKDRIRLLCFNCNMARAISGFCSCGRDRGLI